MKPEDPRNEDLRRLFTVEEADEMLPRLTPLLESLRAAHQAMDERQEAVMSSVPSNGGGPVHREYMRAAIDASLLMDDARALGVVVRDPETGVVDFLAHRGGQDVYLCWRLGEPSVAWWHPLDAGFAGRRPL